MNRRQTVTLRITTAYGGPADRLDDEDGTMRERNARSTRAVFRKGLSCATSQNVVLSAIITCASGARSAASASGSVAS
jgi:hypothetical protein